MEILHWKLKGREFTLTGEGPWPAIGCMEPTEVGQVFVGVVGHMGGMFGGIGFESELGLSDGPEDGGTPPMPACVFIGPVFEGFVGPDSDRNKSLLKFRIVANDCSRCCRC